MPDADTVWLAPLTQLFALLERTGFAVRWTEELSDSHREMADALTQAYADDRAAIAAEVGEPAVAELLAAHRLWVDWLGTGRVRKFAVVAEKRT